MAKAKKAKAGAKPKQGGPFVAAAFFCDYCLEEKTDGALSAIRIIDRINVVVPATWTPTPENNIPVDLTGLILIKSGDTRGAHEMRLVMHTPTRDKHDLMTASMPFEGDEQGVHIRVHAALKVRTEGVYWFDVIVSGKRLTRIPLRIAIERMTDEATAPSDTGETK